MTIPTTITLRGWTGTEHGDNGPTMDEANKRFTEAMFNRFHDAATRWANRDNDPEVRTFGSDTFMEILSSYHIARVHHEAAPYAIEYETLTDQITAATNRADAEYSDLSKNTTVNWLAAHHRFTTATVDARDLMDRRLTVAAALIRALTGQVNILAEPSASIYAKHVPAEHRITKPDLDALRRERDSWVQVGIARFTRTHVTVRGGYPEGFTPMRDDAAVPVPAADDEIVWTSAAWPASVAVANTARGW